MLEEIGISKDVMSYITYDSTGDAITAALGGHVEFVISKPAAASEYVTAGSLIPVLALSTERYTGNLADAPTLSESETMKMWKSLYGAAWQPLQHERCSGRLLE